ncbi:transcription termination factor Rho, partial [Pyxidicoccus sp. 3LG]
MSENSDNRDPRDAPPIPVATRPAPPPEPDDDGGDEGDDEGPDDGERPRGGPVGPGPRAGCPPG